LNIRIVHSVSYFLFKIASKNIVNIKPYNILAIHITITSWLNEFVWNASKDSPINKHVWFINLNKCQASVKPTKTVVENINFSIFIFITPRYQRVPKLLRFTITKYWFMVVEL